MPEMKCPWCGEDIDYGLGSYDANLEAHAEEPCGPLRSERGEDNG